MPKSAPASASASSPAARGLRSNSERQQGAAATTTAAAASASPTTAKRPIEANKSPPTAKSKTNGETRKSQSGGGGSGSSNNDNEWKEKLKGMEERIKVMEEEGKEMKEEIRLLRDRLEEKEWQHRRLEGKVNVLEEIVKDPVEGGGGGRVLEQEIERKLDEKMTEIKEVEKRMDEKMKKIQAGTGDQGGGGGGGGGEVQIGKKKRWIVMTDSNAKDATHHSILNHVPKEEREGVEIEVVVVYTLDRAFYCIERGECDVRDATVLVDTLTNDVRGFVS